MYHNTLPGKFANIINNIVKFKFKTYNNSVKAINYKIEIITNKPSISILWRVHTNK